MKKMRFEDKDRTKTVQKRGFLIALAIGLIAMGIAAWSTVGRINDANNIDDPTNKNIYLPPVDFSPTSPQQVEKNQTGVPYGTDAQNTGAATVNNAPKLFVMPVGGSVVMKYDAKTLQYSETYKDWRLHTGIDIATKKGTPVMASSDGVIKDIYYDEKWGHTIEISHGGGIVTIYSGLTSTSPVKKDQQVELGYKIGNVDNVPCEHALESHIHFAAQKDGKFISPFDDLGIKNR